MESKRRGFKKSKVIMFLYQAPKPSSSVQYSNKVKTSPSAGSMTSTGFYCDAFMDHSKKQKHSYIASETGNDSYGRVEQYNYDEGIDDRAENYISGVRERFSLERGD
ncbi:hypothetical protein CRYUN_Cryun13aG0015800 [Craigia yunnanensis]